jgi:hypothetical protein
MTTIRSLLFNLLFALWTARSSSSACRLGAAAQRRLVDGRPMGARRALPLRATVGPATKCAALNIA